MTSIEAMLYVALGGFVAAVMFGLAGASIFEYENDEQVISKALFGLATLGAGTCIISLGKAALMALGV